MKKRVIAAAVLTVFGAGSASAAPLISAAVTGPSGTVWNTNSSDTFYTLFLVRPYGTVINPTDNFTSTPTTMGANNYSIAGDGFPAGSTTNSDPIYTLALTFADGATITGQYIASAFANGTSTTVGNVTYTLTGFGWNRSPADNVSPFSAVSGGDPADYAGQFSFSEAAAAVPEPATWGMMILGMGAVGFAMRRRQKFATRVAYTA